MSWEDCGFKPGIIYGPDKCTRTCSDCDGNHHFYVTCRDGCLEEDEEREALPKGLNPEAFFECKHCGVKAEMVDGDEDLEGIGLGDDMGPVMRGTDWHDDD